LLSLSPITGYNIEGLGLVRVWVRGRIPGVRKIVQVSYHNWRRLSRPPEDLGSF
jgi:hypothetical protein